MQIPNATEFGTLELFECLQIYKVQMKTRDWMDNDQLRDALLTMRECCAAWIRAHRNHPTNAMHVLRFIASRDISHIFCIKVTRNDTKDALQPIFDEVNKKITEDPITMDPFRTFADEYLARPVPEREDSSDRFVRQCTHEVLALYQLSRVRPLDAVCHYERMIEISGDVSVGIGVGVQRALFFAARYREAIDHRTATALVVQGLTNVGDFVIENYNALFREIAHDDIAYRELVFRGMSFAELISHKEFQFHCLRLIIVAARQNGWSPQTHRFIPYQVEHEKMSLILQLWASQGGSCLMLLPRNLLFKVIDTYIREFYNSYKLPEAPKPSLMQKMRAMFSVVGDGNLW